MPRIVIQLEIEGGETGDSGERTFEEFLTALLHRMHDYTLVDAELLGTTITQDEMAMLAFQTESGKDD